MVGYSTGAKEVTLSLLSGDDTEHLARPGISSDEAFF